MQFNLPPQTPRYFKELQDQEQAEASKATTSKKNIRDELLAIAPGRQRRSLFDSYLRECVAQVLHLPPTRVPSNKSLKTLGLDSLMSLELRNRLEDTLGVTLSATVIWNYPTIDALTPFLAEKMRIPLEESKSQASAEKEAESALQDFDHLNKDEIEALLAEELSAIDDSLKEVALTQKPESDNEVSQLKRALLALKEMRGKLEALEQARSEPLAIIGMGCRFPGRATSPEAFWELLMEGADVITEVPAERWSADEIYAPDFMAPGKANTRWGGFLEHVDHFDPAFFGISPREAMHMDPQQRILLQVAYEALEDAGQSLDKLEGSSAGVFVGLLSHSSDYASMQMHNLNNVDTHTGAGTAHSIIANRLSYLFNWQGPSIALDTACSSSLVAAHLASQSLRNHECNLALVAGVSLLLTPDTTVTFSKLQMMAADGRCKTFDARADGFVRSEGCGVLVLKRLSDAQADGDRILALLQGSAVNQDGRTNGFNSAQWFISTKCYSTGIVQRPRFA